MSILAPTVTNEQQGLSFSSLTNRIIRTVLHILVLLLMLLSALPLALLPITTLVPAPISLLLILADVALLVALVKLRWTGRAVAFALVGSIIVLLLAGGASQTFASTRPLADAGVKTGSGGIAALEKVTLNGSEQWITIRGKDVNKPVLLYLGIGGPGAGGFPATGMNLKPLEDHFVVVNWDQPGTGKSYNAVPISSLTPQRFVDDARALAVMLCDRFHQDKIYVLGLSWGTIVGINLVQQYPELFRGYIGTGQMVNTTENDVIGYEFALKWAAERGDAGTVATLRRNGPPPYVGDGMALKYAAYNDVLFSYMGSPSLLVTMALAPQLAPEYGLLDRVNFDRGLVESFTVLYPQLEQLDFIKQAAKLDVPVFFLVGRNDINAVASLVERYYGVLDAPYKELVWLDSGHGATAQEILDAMVNHVLPVTAR